MNESPNLKPVVELTYEQAVTELESILRAIQGDKCNIDQLTALTSRATELLAACRAKLTTTESELRDILAKLQQ